nr:acetate--CoA ligase [Desulfobacterales bacterium]
MPLDYDTYEEAKEGFRWSEAWEIFDGDRKDFNIAHECVDRHFGDKIGIRIKFDNRRSEIYTFKEVSILTSQFANMLERYGIKKGDRVAISLFPSLEYYISFLGTLKRGAISVPCFPLFGPDALAFRIKDSGARFLIIEKEKKDLIEPDLVSNIIVREDLIKMIQDEEKDYKTDTSADDLAVIQYSSGTTGLPKQVRYPHKAITVSAPFVKFGLGLRRDDNYFCPSSPAWGHGIWYGMMGPLIFGNAIGTYSGKFDPEVLLEALEEFEITNISAAPTVFRMIMNSGKIDNYRLKIERLTYTGEAMEEELFKFLQNKLGIDPHGFYGSTEAGVVLLNYAGFSDWRVKPGSLGKPMLGVKVAVLDRNEDELPPNEVGTLAVKRNDKWIKLGDSGYVDRDGYYWYKGRTDDIIISAGYTIGPNEIENLLLKHPKVLEAAVIGVPDKDRGEIVKAFIKIECEPADDLKKDIQEFVKKRLSRHEYPREIAFVEDLPKTMDGKIRRKELREWERKKRKGLKEKKEVSMWRTY